MNPSVPTTPVDGQAFLPPSGISSAPAGPGKAVLVIGAVKARLRRLASACAVGSAIAATASGQAFAQASSPTGGIGEQVVKMAGEGINSGGIAFGAFCYLAAAVCFAAGVWSAWQSRQPQNRESGYVGKAIAGLALCGLFAGGGIWINKAAVSTTGTTATINTTPQMVQFGSGS